MISFLVNNNPPYLAYPSSAVDNESANVPMHYSYEGYTSGESSSSAFIKNQAASSSQASLPGDVPELYHDQNWPSPHSATSPNMISTPPPEWQTPWQLTDSSYISNNDNPPYQPSPWQGSSLSPRQASRPIVVPIDTNCNWKNHQPRIAEHHSMLFASYDDFDSMQEVNPDPSIFSQATQENNVRNFGLSSSPKLSSSPLSTNTLPSTHSEPLASSPSSYPHTTSQLPLKLHQPRPFRRIPIVSLSDLASACDNFPVPSHTGGTNPKDVPAVDRDFGTHSYVSSFAGTGYLSSHRSNKDFVYGSALALDNRARVIMCPCGCMESYMFH